MVQYAESFISLDAKKKSAILKKKKVLVDGVQE